MSRIIKWSGAFGSLMLVSQDRRQEHREEEIVRTMVKTWEEASDPEIKEFLDILSECLGPRVMRELRKSKKEKKKSATP